MTDSQTWTAFAILAMYETWLMMKLWRVKMPRLCNLSSRMFVLSKLFRGFVRVVSCICQSYYMYSSGVSICPENVILVVQVFYFLSGPSLINVYPCHSLTHWLMFWSLDWHDPGVWRCLLKKVVTVDDFDAEIRVDDIWDLEAEFGHKAKFLFGLCAQGLVKILKFGWSVEVDAWLRFWRWSLIRTVVT